MEEELAQNETRQCLQASLFSILMSPATRSASADVGSTGTASSPTVTLSGPAVQRRPGETSTGVLSKVDVERAAVLFFLPEG